LGALGPLDKKALALKADVRCNQRISNRAYKRIDFMQAFPQPVPQPLRAR